jgi:anti-sigma-K factor RskA
VIYDRPELLDKLASEYVLGTLRGRARRRFEQVLRDHPGARTMVHEWEDRLGRLAASVAPVKPPDRVWAAIEAKVGAEPKAKAQARSGWRDWIKPLAGFAFGAVFAVGLVMNDPGRFVSVDDVAQSRQALPQSYVGLLVNEAGEPALLASSTRYGRRLTVKFLRPVDPGGKVIQLWALPREGPPFPVGVVTSAKPPGSTTLELADTSERLFSNVSRLAVSLEDAPAAGGALPSGPFVLAGNCVKLW